MANQYDIDLPESTLDDMKEAKQRIEAGRRLLRRMKTAGLNTTEREKDLTSKNEQIMKFRDAFFPGKEL